MSDMFAEAIAKAIQPLVEEIKQLKARVRELEMEAVRPQDDEEE